ncbi:MAG: ribosomal export protein [Methanobacterium sp.]|jgi:nonsense-mediated mRNA decay protein 3|uniref:60S ribosomal export protein NMD3 n=1 Tax=Methanobacterium sp. TaxID=2164 RepID=UPI0003C92419|nr:60S ribosomal export protein NMD3 [Methanobacterium sp.]MDI3550743.1 ribosomal export protein [Methanobacterium sp.]CDG65595.1 NMD3 family protein [Methanobacterium sp. MB1]
MFCIECGKEDEELFEGLCSSCFVAGKKLITISPELTVEICAHCSSAHVGDKWVKNELSEEEFIAETIAKKAIPDKEAEDVVLEIDLLNQKGSILELIINARGKILGIPVERELPIKVKINRNDCPECSKYASGYYESVLQLRADKRALTRKEISTADRIIEKVLEKLFRTNRMAYISQRAELKEGVDYYFGSYKASRKISQALKEEMGGILGESPRLMGRDKSAGKDLYRIWISLRLPSFQPGDFLAYSDNLGQVTDLNGKKIMVMDLNTLGKNSISWREYPHLEVVAQKENIKTTTVTSKSPTQIQILHPETYQPVDLDILPEMNSLNIGDPVDVIEIREKLYIIPPKIEP